MTRAPLEEQRLLLQVQAFDSQLARLEHDLKAAPVHTELEAQTARLSGLSSRAIAAATGVKDLQRQVEKLEADTEQVRSRRDRDQERLDAGDVPPRQVAALLDDIAHVTGRIEALEEQELAVMAELEDAIVRRDEVGAELSAATDEQERLVAKVQELEADCAGKSSDVRLRREHVAEQVRDDLLALYESVRTRSAGLGVAELVNRRCGGCRIDLSEGDIQELRAAPADEIVYCVECDRILVRT